ncbi:T-cell surface antigen CD2-like [Protopterus annectens]|uniref:T-cell surface antigen CD2-like n=1 Tax=Protopterus annectens TaxID=7888 RepID=UPI001CFB6A76|nr:T-cell surface antigen CD2-like [Protopterus annectens]
MAHLYFTVFMLMVADLSVSGHGNELPVYGILGNTVLFHVNYSDISFVSDVFWKKDNLGVARFKNMTSISYAEYNNRIKILPGGDLEIKHTRKNDTGIYRFDMFDDEGKLLHGGSFYLYLLDPISEPWIAQNCSSDGAVELSCRVNAGTNISFSWSLDECPLENDIADFSNDYATVTLKESVSGQFTCSVRNQLYEQHSNHTRITINCTGILKYMLIAAPLFGLVMVVVLAVTFCCIFKRQRQASTQESRLWIVKHDDNCITTETNFQSQKDETSLQTTPVSLHPDRSPSSTKEHIPVVQFSLNEELH